jgi:PAS domain S-box-containing protein
MDRRNSEMLQFYRKVFDDFPALIWRAGLDMGCDYFNNTWLEFTGRSMEQELGQGWAEGVHLEDLAACMATYVEAFEGRRPFTMHYRLRHRSGEYRWIRDIGRPFYDVDERFIGYIGSCYDVTKERDNELKLLELNRTKDKYFSIVAHDLIGPITSIESLTGLIERDYKLYSDSEMVELVHELGSASTSVVRFLRDILEWAYSQFQGTKCRPQDLLLRDICETAVEPLRQNIKVKALSLIEDLDPGISVRADPDMAKTIVRNLVANAIKFCRPRKEIRLSARVEGDYASLRVSDQGIGISPDDMEFLFDLEHRRKRLGTEGEKGTGLGLVLCKDFAERNGGRISAESSLGEGSSFIVELPLSGSGKAREACL